MIERVAQRALHLAAPDLGDNVAVSVTCVDDETIHELNREHRNIDRATDVLSFSQLEGEEMPGPPEGQPLPVGDIVISIERCAAQAEDYGHSFERELGFLVGHGMLHLLGYDHQTPEEEAAMMAKTEEILGELGLTR
jgi:probable rRNA maturation factor